MNRRKLSKFYKLFKQVVKDLFWAVDQIATPGSSLRQRMTLWRTAFMPRIEPLPPVDAPATAAFYSLLSIVCAFVVLYFVALTLHVLLTISRATGAPFLVSCKLIVAVALSANTAGGTSRVGVSLVRNVSAGWRTFGMAKRMQTCVALTVLVGMTVSLILIQ